MDTITNTIPMSNRNKQCCYAGSQASCGMLRVQSRGGEKEKEILDSVNVCLSVQGHYDNLMADVLKNYPHCYKQFIGIDPVPFHEMLGHLDSQIQRKDTKFRGPLIGNTGRS
jgi:hypothetical protein